MKLGLGLYTVYDGLKADLDDTLRRTAEMGYTGVEFFGPAFWRHEEVRDSLARNGLAVCGWHTEWRLLQEDTLRGTIAYHQAIGNPTLVVPALGGPWNIAHTAREDCEAVWSAHAKWMRELAKLLEGEGMRLGYHTHAHEFSLRYASGRRPYDILAEECPNVILELDTGNCIEGGGDPVAALRESRNSKLVHLKPFSHTREFNILLGDEDDANDWPAIVRQCREDGAEWLLVEDEAGGLGDKFVVARRCFERMSALMEESK